MPEALIFDFDGLILDTEVPVYEAWRKDFLSYGHDLDLRTYSQCVGSTFGQFNPKHHLELLVGNVINWSHLDENRERHALEITHQLDPLPGIIPLLTEANEAEIPCIVASSSPRSWVESHLNRLGLMHHFIGTRCLDDVKHAKPAPDLFLAATEFLAVNPSRSIVLEDSFNGLTASIAAGIPCVVVPNKITAHYEFDGAASVLPSLEGIGLNYFQELLEESAPQS
jgi:HAD superfamily hydrolase (TIGR01509 family)